MRRSTLLIALLGVGFLIVLGLMFARTAGRAGIASPTANLQTGEVMPTPTPPPATPSLAPTPTPPPLGSNVPGWSIGLVAAGAVAALIGIARLVTQKSDQ